MMGHDAMQMLQTRIAALESAMRRLLVPAKVVSVQNEPYMVRLDIAAAGEAQQLTRFVPVLTAAASPTVKFHRPVQHGERGLLLSPTGNTAAGYYLPAAFSAEQSNSVPEGERDEITQYTHGGVVIKINDSGDVITVEATNATVTADVHIIGNLGVSGNITATGEITGSDLKTPTKPAGYNEHTHGGVDTGPGSTAEPNG